MALVWKALPGHAASRRRRRERVPAEDRRDRSDVCLARGRAEARARRPADSGSGRFWCSRSRLRRAPADARTLRARTDRGRRKTVRAPQQLLRKARGASPDLPSAGDPFARLLGAVASASGGDHGAGLGVHRGPLRLDRGGRGRVQPARLFPSAVGAGPLVRPAARARVARRRRSGGGEGRPGDERQPGAGGGPWPLHATSSSPARASAG